MKLLSVVEHVFDLTGRGIVVLPGIPRREREWRIVVGQDLILKRPDGSEVRTAVRGIEMGSPPDGDGIGLLLGQDMTADSVPVGTAIWVE